MKISELLSSPEKWTQRSYARDALGGTVQTRSKDAVCWCLVGALLKCYSGDAAFGDVNASLEAAIRRRQTKGTIPTLASWNDLEGRTFAEVRAIVEEAGV